MNSSKHEDELELQMPLSENEIETSYEYLVELLLNGTLENKRIEYIKYSITNIGESLKVNQSIALFQKLFLSFPASALTPVKKSFFIGGGGGGGNNASGASAGSQSSSNQTSSNSNSSTSSSSNQNQGGKDNNGQVVITREYIIENLKDYPIIQLFLNNLNHFSDGYIKRQQQAADNRENGQENTEEGNGDRGEENVLSKEELNELLKEISIRLDFLKFLLNELHLQLDYEHADYLWEYLVTRIQLLPVRSLFFQFLENFLQKNQTKSKQIENKAIMQGTLNNSNSNPNLLLKSVVEGGNSNSSSNTSGSGIGDLHKENKNKYQQPSNTFILQNLFISKINTIPIHQIQSSEFHLFENFFLLSNERSGRIKKYYFPPQKKRIGYIVNADASSFSNSFNHINQSYQKDKEKEKDNEFIGLDNIWRFLLESNDKDIYLSAIECLSSIYQWNLLLDSYYILSPYYSPPPSSSSSSLLSNQSSSLSISSSFPSPSLLTSSISSTLSSVTPFHNHSHLSTSAINHLKLEKASREHFINSCFQKINESIAAYYHSPSSSLQSISRILFLLLVHLSLSLFLYIFLSLSFLLFSTISFYSFPFIRLISFFLSCLQSSFPSICIPSPLYIFPK